MAARGHDRSPFRRGDGLPTARSAAVTASAMQLGRIECGLAQPQQAIRYSPTHLHLNRLLAPSGSYEQLIYALLERASRSLTASPPSP
jgi:hypothetical protein